jgi:Protein of unknown function (DUF2510)
MADQGAREMPSAPAGWFPDAERPGGERYWDGAGWTDHRRSASQIAETQTAAPPGWYRDSQMPGGERYWDGARWTDERRAATDIHATGPGPPDRGRFFSWVSRRPVLAFWATLVLSAVVGIGIGIAASIDGSNEDELDATKGDLSAARDARQEAEGRLSRAESEVDRLRQQLDASRSNLADTSAKLRKAEQAPAPAPAPAPEPASASGGSTGEAQRFSGNGRESLGTITVSSPSTLSWTTDGDSFRIWDKDFDLNVNAQGDSGTRAVDSGTYTDVSVKAVGNWTITIEPQ